MPEPISVLIIDDSALMRSVISRIVESAPGLRVADRAMNGKFGLEKIARANPDVIVLDLEMPEMDGIAFLKERRRLGVDVPVVILSSLARQGAGITMNALSLGASDFITKPSGPASEDIRSVGKDLASMLLGYGSEYRRKKGRERVVISEEEIERSFKPSARDRGETGERQPLPVSAPIRARYETPVPLRAPGQIDIIAIGISTGGPNALREIFSSLDPGLSQPIVVVQHMPAGFTEEFARSLDRICPLEVKEAAEGDVLRGGRILIAPGNWHMEVEKRALSGIVHVTDAPHVNSHRPSVDVLFASVAKHYGNRALGVIMTGMGSDGARELGSIYREGGRTLGQDEASSIVYGMPKVAFDMGHVQRQVPLSGMARAISELAKEFRGA
jgi:two-component system, chemotaxis family, protein-glutamate methylesterase/glutaminase